VAPTRALTLADAEAWLEFFAQSKAASEALTATLEAAVVDQENWSREDWEAWLGGPPDDEPWVKYEEREEGCPLGLLADPDPSLKRLARDRLYLFARSRWLVRRERCRGVQPPMRVHRRGLSRESRPAARARRARSPSRQASDTDPPPRSRWSRGGR
jgi:hypothetical protein